MLKHTNTQPTSPKRVVVVGARSFLGAITMRHLEQAGIETLGLTSADLDLTEPASAALLAGQLREDDALVMFAALTPDKGKDVDTLIRNLRMAETVCAALDERPVAHVIYFSSDAVYPMGEDAVNEDTCAAPQDLYGNMHKTREVLFQDRVGCPLTVLRPTMIYGAGDTHNSYGPNRFRRTALQDGKITLGGNGEETRDHVFVQDVAEIVKLCLDHRSQGVLNVATGTSTSFFDVATMVAQLCVEPVEIVCTGRSMPVTHRTFDISATKAAFPAFSYTALQDGLKRAHGEGENV